MPLPSFASFLLVAFFVFGIIAGTFHRRTEQSLMASAVFLIVLFLMGQPSFVAMYAIGAAAGYILYAYFVAKSDDIHRKKKETIQL